MADINTLAFHIVSEIAEGTVKVKEDANKWCQESLANYQELFVKDEEAKEETINTDKRLPNFSYKVLDKLEECRAIGKKKSDNFKYTTLPIGRISSWFYLSPFDIASWASNFKTILTSDNPSTEDIAWALGNTFSKRLDYDVNLDDLGKDLIVRLGKKGRPMQGGVSKHVYAVYCILKNITPKIPELNNLLMAHRMDSERIISSINVLNNTSEEFSGLIGETVLLELPYRIRYGMGRVGIELLMLPGIGAKTVQAIFKRRIRTCKELVAAHAMGQSVLANNKWLKVKDVAEEIARIGYVAYLKKDKRK